MDDRIFMKKALDLAARGISTVSPNPMVGCVIVKSGKIVGQGYHKKTGGPHAEVIALRQAGSKSKGATMYVTLEPCSHFGKTPPCAKAVIASGVKEVVIAQKDPNPKVNGIKELRNAGIKVTQGILENEAKKLNEVFSKYITTRLPFVTLKIAATLDGSIATASGSSQYITSKESRTLVHQWRTEVDAVMVGKNTVLKDNPQLTPRHVKGKDPLKIVVDSKAAFPLSSNLMKNPHKLILATTTGANKKKLKALSRKGVAIIICKTREGKVDLQDLMRELGKRSITGIMMEAGSALATAALRQQIVDKVRIFIAPKIIGGGVPALGDLGVQDISRALHLEDIDIKRVGDDVLIEGYI